jgi:hypothetical protein
MKHPSTPSLVALMALAPLALGCSKASGATTADSVAQAVAAATPHVDGNHYKLDEALVGDCKSGAECAVAVRLEALGEYHINLEYPYKFKAADAPGVEFLGKDPAAKNIFSKGAGDWKQDSEKVATMTVRWKAAQAGAPNIGGTYKMSVCSAANCQLEQQKLALAVTVK